MTWAIVAYLAAVAVMVVCAYTFYARSRIAGLAACGMITLQIFVRPVLFFLGLDEPSPPEFFARDSWELVSGGVVVGAVWMVVLTGVYWLVYPAIPSRGLYPRQPGRIYLSHVLLLAAVMTALNVLGTMTLVVEAGGFAKFQYAVKVEKALAGLFVIRELGELAQLLCAVALFAIGKVAREDDPANQRRKLMWLIAVMIFINFAINFAWGNRINIALFLLAAFCGWHFAVKRMQLWRIALWGGTAITALFLLRRVRSALTSSAINKTYTIQSDNVWREMSQSLHFSEFDALMLAWRDAGTRFSFSYGQEFLNGILAWIPRWIYPNKDSHIIGAWFRQIYQPDIVNGWPVTLPGSWYLNFNYPGIFLGAALSGILVAMLDKTYADHSSAWNVAMVSVLGFSLLHGGLSFGFIQSYVLMIVPILALGLVLRFLARNHENQASRLHGRGALMRTS